MRLHVLPTALTYEKSEVLACSVEHGQSLSPNALAWCFRLATVVLGVCMMQ